ncbi:MAG: AcrR family transcriptional regulator [Oleiphilaceae bacterium]|jgi:AcrR family transcriptional regulator
MNKRDELIDSALQLFYQSGIHAVGINEVLAKSGIAKKTLYKYFSSKDALILACVVERDQRYLGWFTSRCQDSNSTTNFIELIFTALDDWVNGRTAELGHFGGCFFINVAAEYSDEQDPIFQQCMQHKLNIKYFLYQQLNLIITDQKQVDLILNALLLLKEGVINCAFVMGDKQAAIKAKNIAHNLL